MHGTVSKNIFLKCCHHSYDTWNAIMIIGQSQLTVSLIVNLRGGEKSETKVGRYISDIDTTLF